ncbi:MAG: phenylacetate--CoA ligase family protein, partial [Pseudomonadota bacterium]
MLDKVFYDDLETRDAEQRAADMAQALPDQIARAKIMAGYAERLGDVDPDAIKTVADLAKLPILRKTDLGAAQRAHPPLGGFTTGVSQFSHIFQSPGPIYEPGSHDSKDWWRFARFLHAVGIHSGDIVQNCFSYHLTPAGIMFENGATAIGAGVLPAGTGQTEMQVTAARDIGTTAYAGT